MAAVMGRTEISIKRTTSATTVPNDPIAKLMYYFDCVCSCVEIGNDSELNRLRAYKDGYAYLSNEEKAKLLTLCLALSPDKLMGAIFFPAPDDAFNEYPNEFFELSSVSTRLVVAESLLVGGQQKKVRKIMMFKKSWMDNYYLNPLRSISSAGEDNRRALPSPPRRRARERSGSCVIL